MNGTNKIVNDILDEYLSELAKVETLDKEIISELKIVIKDDKSVTPVKIEQIIYGEIKSL